MNEYAPVGVLKAELKKTTTTDDTVLLRHLERSAREIDGMAGRTFYAETDTRVFDGDGTNRLRIDDLISATTVKVDADGDGTYELTLASNTDYWLYPDNPPANTPYTHIDLNPESAVATVFPNGRRRVQIVGLFGYSNEYEACGTLGAAITTTTATAITMTAGHGLTGGETILIGSEQLAVTLVVTNAVTVVRGINGTTAATALITATVTRRRYDRRIETACVIRAADIWRGTQTGYGQVAEQEIGGYQSNTAYAQFRGLVWDVARNPVVVV